MKRIFFCITILTALIPATGFSQDLGMLGGDSQSLPFELFAENPPLPNISANDFDWLSLDMPSNGMDFNSVVVRGQDSGGESGGGGAGASAATDPSAILTQLQLQNVFTPESYGGSGYANTFIVQPVLPFPVAMPGLKHLFPAHIVRPTLPFPTPTADPDGPAGDVSGMGDLTLLDVYVHQIEGFGTALLGYNAVLPTSTHRQLGRGEWQLGPAGGLLYKQIPKTLLGVLVTTQFSFQSDAQQVNVSPVIVRHLPDEWYVGWGEIFWTFDTDTGDYHIPLEVRVGKVCKIGCQTVNIFVEPFYTPAGLHSGPGGVKWGVKLNCTFLFPDKKFKAPLGFLWGGQSCCSSGCQ